MASLTARGLSISSLLHSKVKFTSINPLYARNNSPCFFKPVDFQVQSFHTKNWGLFRAAAAPQADAKKGSSAPTPEQEAAFLSKLTTRPNAPEQKRAAQLIAFAAHNGVINEVKKDAHNILRIVKSDRRLVDALTDRSNSRKEILTYLQKTLQLNPLFVSFLNHLDRENEFSELAAILAQYEKYVKEYNRELDIKITFAKEPKSDEVNRLTIQAKRELIGDLFKKTGKIEPNLNINTTISVDKALASGFIIESGDWIEDHSGRTSYLKKQRAYSAWVASLPEKFQLTDVNEVIPAHQNPDPELVDREEVIATARELKGILELKPESLKKLKDHSFFQKVSEVLAEAHAFSPDLPLSLEPYSNFDSLAAGKKTELQGKAKSYSQAVDPLIKNDETELQQLKDSNYFGNLPPIQRIMNEVQRSYVKLEGAKTDADKKAVQKTIDESISTIKSRVTKNRETDFLLYHYKLNYWKAGLTINADETSPIWRATKKLVDDFGKQVASSTFSLPADIPEVKYSFSNLKKMSVDELLTVPHSYFRKLTYKQQQQLPFDEMLKKFESNPQLNMPKPFEVTTPSEPEKLESKPLDIEEIRKIDLRKLDPVDIDVVSYDIREELRGAVFHRNTYLRTSLNEDLGIFDQPLESLLSAPLRKLTLEEQLNAPQVWKDLNVKLQQAAAKPYEERASFLAPIADKLREGFTVYVLNQIQELPQEVLNRLRDLNKRIVQLRALDNEIDGKIKALGLQPIPKRIYRL